MLIRSEKPIGSTKLLLLLLLFLLLLSGFSKAPDARQKSPVTFSICAGYLLYSKVSVHINDVADYGQRM